jgi:hypothetical protein
MDEHLLESLLYLFFLGILEYRDCFEPSEQLAFPEK